MSASPENTTRRWKVSLAAFWTGPLALVVRRPSAMNTDKLLPPKGSGKRLHQGRQTRTCKPVIAPGGMTRVPCLSVVQYATTAASISPMVLLAVGLPQRQKSLALFKMAVWHSELGPTVVELHRL